MAKSRLIILLILCLLASSSKKTIGNNVKPFSVESIADSLKKDAFAVVRFDDCKVLIKSLKEVEYSEHVAITILNKKANKYSSLTIPYSSNIKIIDIELKLYNSKGEFIKEYGKKHFKDISADPYGAVYSDMRYKMFDINSTEEQYTYEYKIKVSRNNTYFITPWLPVIGYNVSLEESTYTIDYPAGLEIINKETNTNIVSKDSSDRHISWRLSNFKAVKGAPFSPNLKTSTPFVRTELSEFYYEGPGSKKSWGDFGLFFTELNKGRDGLSDELKILVKNILNTCKTDEEKVRALYSFLQSNTRYVSIQDGIGGIQPFPASTVSENGYGDCKALSNYMVSMLKYAGFKAYYTKVYAGRGQYFFDKDFVSHQSNHVIVSVPMENDTIWLECTSQTMPFGYLGDFTDNRYALMITEEGGKLVKTPEYKKEDNRIERKIMVDITDFGNVNALSESRYSGMEYDDVHRLAFEDVETQKKMLYEDLDISDFKINGFDITSSEGPYPVLTEALDLKLNNHVRKSSTRAFVPLNVIGPWSYIPQDEERDRDIDVKFAYVYCDTVIYTLPQNYTLEALPESVDITSDFGEYKRTISYNDNKIVYTRYIGVNKGLFHAGKYSELIDFYKAMANFDDDMFVLKME